MHLKQRPQKEGTEDLLKKDSRIWNIKGKNVTALILPLK